MTLSPMQLAAISEALSGLVDLDGEPIEGEVGEQLEGAYQMRVCQECGKAITRYLSPAHLARGKGQYCSHACLGRARGKRGTGESKNRSTQLREYHSAKREGRWLA